MKIAFLGLGQMGSAMVRNLIAHGHELVVWNRSPGPVRLIEAAGAASARTPAQAAEGAEIAITMLAEDGAAEAVVLSAGGLAEGLAAGAVHVSMSTISAALSEKFAAEHARRGQAYAAAPVFGRPEAAQAQKLFVAVAGAPETIRKITPALEDVGQRVFVIGELPQQANLVKLAGNFLITCVIEGLAEAYALAAKGGVNPRAVHDLLTETLFAAPVYKTYGALILEGAYAPPGFKMPLGLKDNRLLLQAAEALRTPLPFAAVIRDRFLAALANGDGELDWSAIARRAAADAGIAAPARESEDPT